MTSSADGPVWWRRPKYAGFRYPAALLAGALANVLGDALADRWDAKLPFVTFYTVLIVATAWFGGLGPGLVCTSLCALAAAYFWLDPGRSFSIESPSDLVALAMFLAIGLAISLLCEQFHRSLLREAAARAFAERAMEAERTARRAREEVLGVVAHDLRGPLSVFETSASLMELTASPGDAGASARRRAGVLHRTVERMRRLIDDLLDRAALDAGRLAIEMGTVEVRRLLLEASEPYAQAAAVGSVLLEIEPPEDVDLVRCDRGRALQVLSNLIGNALKFTPEGGRVMVRARGVGQEVLFEVTDTGRGIPPAKLPHIFDRYWSDRRSAGGGTGLGLSIAKSLVEAQGGRIDVFSREGRGTRFEFTLPAALEMTPPASLS
jgi:signal transduction histidine kinase